MLGIGRGIAVELWRAGAEVVAISRTKSYLDSLQKEYPSITTVALDLANWDESRKVLETLGHFDCLVNNAALGLTEDFLTTTSDNFDLTRRKLEQVAHASRKTLVGALLHYVVDGLIRRSTIRDRRRQESPFFSGNIFSEAALWGHVTYSATKGAIDAMTRVMALELGPHNIRVNAVNPTVIMTEMGRLGWSDPQKAQGMLSKIPLGRFGEVSEVVNAVCFLLSDKASMINGVELPIDGGFLAC
ncbi:hypothetical protein MSG28_004106 [Choristoneura fumiferana]|uniref:Uncharacterized protein n=1 Tax=Choristoneura fumiferana TaxID=7141 RepID=A0ACC0KI34_CHOFU|nr:hypothetical protein MSG28_004106 [Choristoneura fumiferana]